MDATPDPANAERELPRRCAWCGRTPVDGVWVADVQATMAAHEATHGICPDCFEEQEQKRRHLRRVTRIYRRQRPSA